MSATTSSLSMDLLSSEHSDEDWSQLDSPGAARFSSSGTLSALTPTAHTWESHQFKKPTYCSACKKFIWGVGFKQGQRCLVCPYVAHHGCTANAPLSCLPADRGAQQDAGHHWTSGNLSGAPGRCFLCSSLIIASLLSGSFSAAQCTQCHLLAHVDCVDRFSSESFAAARVCTPKFSALWPSGATPLFVLFNRRSGGGQGAAVERRLKRCLLPSQLFDMGQGGPRAALEAAVQVPGARLLVCGGDGSVCWVFSVLDSLLAASHDPASHDPASVAPNTPFIIPPTAVLPLGTGNDLSRYLGWGPGYQDEALAPHLSKITRAAVKLLDRWDVSIVPSLPTPHGGSAGATEGGTESGGGTEGEGDGRRQMVMNNYFSIGVDADIALSFHTLREEHPEKCNTRAKNKLVYAKYGLKATTSYDGRIAQQAQIIMDGRILQPPANIAGLVVLNISSYGGGCDMWGGAPSPFPVSSSDRRFEVVGVKGAAHLGAIQSRLKSAIRLGQAESIQIQLITPLAAQVDGEPFQLQPCAISITHKNQFPMLYIP